MSEDGLAYLVPDAKALAQKHGADAAIVIVLKGARSNRPKKVQTTRQGTNRGFRRGFRRGKLQALTEATIAAAKKTATV